MRYTDVPPPVYDRREPWKYKLIDALATVFTGRQSNKGDHLFDCQGSKH